MKLSEKQISTFEKIGNFEIISSVHLRTVARIKGTGYKNEIYKIETDKGTFKATVHRNNYQDGQLNDNYYVSNYSEEEEKQNEYKKRMYNAYKTISHLRGKIEEGQKFYHELTSCGMCRRKEAIIEVLGDLSKKFPIDDMGQMSSKTLAYFLVKDD